MRAMARRAASEVARETRGAEVAARARSKRVRQDSHLRGARWRNGVRRRTRSGASGFRASSSEGSRSRSRSGRVGSGCLSARASLGPKRAGVTPRVRLSPSCEFSVWLGALCSPHRRRRGESEREARGLDRLGMRGGARFVGGGGRAHLRRARGGVIHHANVSRRVRRRIGHDERGSRRRARPSAPARVRAGAHAPRFFSSTGRAAVRSADELGRDETLRRAIRANAREPQNRGPSRRQVGCLLIILSRAPPRRPCPLPPPRPPRRPRRRSRTCPQGRSARA